MGKTIERAALLLLIGCVVVLTALNVKREFSSGQMVELAQAELAPEYLPTWQTFADRGITSGPADARIHIIEFSDLECPFCRRFHGALETLQKRGIEAHRVFVHYPVETHRFAWPAARASLCAHEAGRFAGFVNAVYEAQDSLGLKSWAQYAQQAGITDLESFDTCLVAAASVDHFEDIIPAGKLLGDSLGVRGTPTVIINGWRLPSPPHNHLEAVIDSILRRVPPYAR
jgi:protein-disulfide isomerase